MRIALTGATGFVGGALTRRLLAEKQEVRVLARASRKADELEARGVTVIRGELGDASAIERTIEGAEIVYHLAARVSGSRSEREFTETNVGGTQRVLEACARHGVRRVVYHSSLAVYGPGHGATPIDESSPFDPHPELRGYYPESKIKADQFAASFAREKELSVVILRPGLIYGPGRIPLGLLAFALGKTHFVFGQPSLHLPVNYIENLLDAIRMAGSWESREAEEFNIVDDEDLTLGEYHRALNETAHARTIFLPGWPVEFSAPGVDLVTRALGLMAGSRLTRYQVRRMLEDRFYPMKKIRTRLGWTARVPVSEALRRSLGDGR
jgi:2-alkyl-3-oxoalkanoate reductase